MSRVCPPGPHRDNICVSATPTSAHSPHSAPMCSRASKASGAHSAREAQAVTNPRPSPRYYIEYQPHIFETRLGNGCGTYSRTPKGYCDSERTLLTHPPQHLRMCECIRMRMGTRVTMYSTHVHACARTRTCVHDSCAAAHARLCV